MFFFLLVQNRSKIYRYVRKFKSFALFDGINYNSSFLIYEVNRDEKKMFFISLGLNENRDD